MLAKSQELAGTQMLVGMLGMLTQEHALARLRMLMGMQTLDETWEMLPILRALGGTMLAGSAAFCVVSRGVVDAWASTAVASAWGCLDGITSSRSGLHASCGVTLWTKYSAHSSGSAVNLTTMLNCCAKFHSCIRGGAPVATL